MDPSKPIQVGGGFEITHKEPTSGHIHEFTVTQKDQTGKSQSYTVTYNTTKTIDETEIQDLFNDKIEGLIELHKATVEARGTSNVKITQSGKGKTRVLVDDSKVKLATLKENYIAKAKDQAQVKTIKVFDRFIQQNINIKGGSHRANLPPESMVLRAVASHDTIQREPERQPAIAHDQPRENEVSSHLTPKSAAQRPDVNPPIIQQEQEDDNLPVHQVIVSNNDEVAEGERQLLSDTPHLDAWIEELEIANQPLPNDANNLNQLMAQLENETTRDIPQEAEDEGVESAALNVIEEQEEDIPDAAHAANDKISLADTTQKKFKNTDRLEFEDKLIALIHKFENNKINKDFVSNCYKLIETYNEHPDDLAHCVEDLRNVAIAAQGYCIDHHYHEDVGKHFETIIQTLPKSQQISKEAQKYQQRKLGYALEDANKHPTSSKRIVNLIANYAKLNETQKKEVKKLATDYYAKTSKPSLFKTLKNLVSEKSRKKFDDNRNKIGYFIREPFTPKKVHFDEEVEKRFSENYKRTRPSDGMEPAPKYEADIKPQQDIRPKGEQIISTPDASDAEPSEDDIDEIVEELSKKNTTEELNTLSSAEKVKLVPSKEDIPKMPIEPIITEDDLLNELKKDSNLQPISQEKSLDVKKRADNIKEQVKFLNKHPDNLFLIADFHISLNNLKNENNNLFLAKIIKINTFLKNYNSNSIARLTNKDYETIVKSINMIFDLIKNQFPDNGPKRKYIDAKIREFNKAFFTRQTTDLALHLSDLKKIILEAAELK